MEFDLQSSRPIWLQLSEQLSRRILTGVYPPGSRCAISQPRRA